MLRIITLTILIGIGFALGGCYDEDPRSKAIDQRLASEASPPATQTEWSPSIGISPSGRLGLEIAPGIMLDTDGNIGFGMGF